MTHDEASIIAACVRSQFPARTWACCPNASEDFERQDVTRPYTTARAARSIRSPLTRSRNTPAYSATSVKGCAEYE